MKTIEKLAIEAIYEKYKNLYGFPQGLCFNIAKEIQSFLGGEIVAGYLCFSGGQREHWWLERNGEIIDPMSDELKLTDNHYHFEVHRDHEKGEFYEG